MIKSLIYVLALICTVAAFRPFNRVSGATRQNLMRRPLSMTFSPLSGMFEPVSLVLATEQRLQIEAYESSGVPPVFLLGSLGLVVVSVLLPVISRKRQVAKNSRSIDETDFFDEVLEEKLTDNTKLNESYDDKGAVGRYTKD